VRFGLFALKHCHRAHMLRKLYAPEKEKVTGITSVIDPLNDTGHLPDTQTGRWLAQNKRAAAATLFVRQVTGVSLTTPGAKARYVTLVNGTNRPVAGYLSVT